MITLRDSCLIVVVGVLSACSGGSGPEHCELGNEQSVARVVAKDFDAIELVRTDAGPLAIWSEPSGTFVRALHADGRPRAGTVRVGPRCEGGLAAAGDGSELELACLAHAATAKTGDEGGLFVQRLSRELRVTRRQVLGRAGPLSEGVTLVRAARGFEVAWQDASSEAHRIVWAKTEDPDSAREVSQPGRMAFSPSLSERGGATVLAWAENWVERDRLESRIALYDHRATPRTALRIAHSAASPRLVNTKQGLVLAYRDRLRESDKPGLHVVRLGAGGEALESPLRVGRADGVGRPALCACMGGIVTATPRTYGGDYFVGINWLTPELERLRGEQQFYEDSHAFTQVAAVCLGSHALLLVAEFPQLQRETTALRAVPYRCR
jgi:hypothetical protein